MPFGTVLATLVLQHLSVGTNFYQNEAEMIFICAFTDLTRRRQKYLARGVILSDKVFMLIARPMFCLQVGISTLVENENRQFRAYFSRLRTGVEIIWIRTW